MSRNHLFRFILCLGIGLVLLPGGFLPLWGQEFPSLNITSGAEEDRSALFMESLKVEVEVIGPLARTTMEMTFKNDLDRVLEGELEFPLGEGQTVSRFAMDINGKLREGVFVEKDQGREAFETIVRRGIDPGLLEQTKGNNFKARVYPIPARGRKTIVVAFSQELDPLEKGYLYLLPLNFKEKVDDFSLKVNVFRQEVQPTLQKGGLANLSFERWEEGWRTFMEEQDFLPNEQLGFVVPNAATEIKVAVQPDTEGLNWTYMTLRPPVKTARKKLPKNITLLWDVSGSGNDRNISREMDLLEKYFEALGKARITVVLFGHKVHGEKIYYVEKGKCSLLRDHLEKQWYDGGTQLGVLDFRKWESDEFILVSDGHSNFGKKVPTLPNGVPVQVIGSAQTGNHGFLRGIALKTGGNYLNLNETEVADAARQLSQENYRFLGAKVLAGSFSQPTPSIPTLVKDEFSLCGRAGFGPVKLSLEFGTSGKVMHREVVEFNPMEIRLSSGNLVHQTWASKMSDELSMNKDENREALIKLGKEHGIVTPFTSLIVLDRVEDYVEFDIKPPAELKDEYEFLMAQKMEEEENVLTDRLNWVYGIWKERLDWWKKDFPKDDPPKLETKEKNNESFDAGNDAWDEAFGEDDDWGGDWEEDELEEEMDVVESSESMKVIDVDDAVFGDEFGEFDAEDEDAWDGDDWGGDDEEAGEDESPEMEGLAAPRFKGKINVNTWQPDEPYLTELRSAGKNERFALYLELKKVHGAKAYFFLDVADFFREEGEKELALQILSNLAEMDLENHRVLRVLGHRLRQLGFPELSVMVFEEVLVLRPEEPQSYRDLALAEIEIGADQAAIGHFWEVISQKWDERFNGIELISLEEMNRLIRLSDKKLDVQFVDKRFRENLTSDVRVVLDWDADNADMDLWVIDPNEERCYYSNKRTYLGGFLTDDMTGGYGPEAYMLRKAKAGEFVVKVKYYSNSQQSLTGPTTLHLTFFTGFGTKKEKKEEVTIRLTDGGDVIEVARFEIEK